MRTSRLPNEYWTKVPGKGERPDPGLEAIETPLAVRRNAKNNAGMKLLIVDDHAILREGLVALLQQFEPGAMSCRRPAPWRDCALRRPIPISMRYFLDLNMPEQGGMEVIPAFVQRARNCR